MKCFDLPLGYGGGYNERDNVEYNEKKNDDDSDGEYDEVGRRNAPSPSSTPLLPVP